VISDEVYRTVIYDQKEHLSIAMKEYLPNQTFVVGGISKEVAGTGLRLGFVCCNSEYIIHILAKIQGNSSSSNNLPVQIGYAKFLQSDLNMVERNKIRDELKIRRDVIVKQFSTLDGLRDVIWLSPKGAFYFFPNIINYIGRKTPEGNIIHNDEELSLFILHDSGVATIAGSKFSKPNHLRLAFACMSIEEIQSGIANLASSLQKLTK